MTRLGIRSRVMLVAVAPALTIALLLAVYFTQVRFADLEGALRDTGLAMARQLALSAEYGVFAGNREALEALAAATAREVNVVGVGIRDREGRILAGRGRVPEAPFPATGGREPVQIEDTRGQILITSASIFQTRLALEELFDTGTAAAGAEGTPTQTRLIGHAYVVLSTETLIAQRNRLLRDGVLVALLVLAGGVVLAMRMARAVTRPVNKLTQAVQRIASGDLGTR